MDVQHKNVFRSSIYRRRSSLLAETTPRGLSFCGFLSLPSSPSTSSLQTTVKQRQSSSPPHPTRTLPKRRPVPPMTCSTTFPVLHVPQGPNVAEPSLHITYAATLTESPTLASGSRSRPLFHISQEVSSDDGHNDYFTSDPHDRSPEGGTLIMEKASSIQSSQEDTRRYHALMELLTTEVGYLMDLRDLVAVSILLIPKPSNSLCRQIYLRQLPTLTYRSSASGSLSAMPFGRTQSPSGIPSTSRVNSRTQVHPSAAPVSHTSLPVDSEPQMQGAGNDRVSPRYLFSDTEIETLTRNAEEILQLHEHFVEELQAAVAPFGFTAALSESGINPHDYQKKGLDLAQGAVDAAIGAVATIFATKVRHFSTLSSDF